MKGLVIINAYPNGEKFIRQGGRIASELRLLGIQTEVVRNGEFYVAIDSDGMPVCNLKKEYSFAVYLDKDKYLGRLLETCGMRLFNSARVVEICDDKLHTYQALQGSKLKVCKSIPAPLCYTPHAKAMENYLKFVEGELGYPLVAKKSYGSLGKGVQLVHGYSELKDIEQKWLYEPHFYQKYVSQSFGRDIRVIVIGGKAVAAMERIAQKGEFRSNIELGGKGKRICLSKPYRDAAELAARTIGLDYCGVDLLEGEAPIICEVNSNAFFEGIEETTGINVARLYAEYILSQLKKQNEL